MMKWSMFSLNRWFLPPRRLLVVFLGITFLFAGALAWLGWRLLEQDRALEKQRTQERLDHYADRIASGLRHRLGQTNEELTRLLAMQDTELNADAPRTGEDLGADALITVLRAESMEAYPAGRLLYYPYLAEPSEPPAREFDDGEAIEFRSRDPARAISEFRKPATSQDPAIRAGALLRLARNQRKADRPRAALATYDELRQLDATPIAIPTGPPLPAGLLAQDGRCELLAELNRRSELQNEAETLNRDLHKGRWRLSRPAFLFYRDQAARWLDSDPELLEQIRAAERSKLALADAVEELWETWQRIQKGDGKPAGR